MERISRPCDRWLGASGALLAAGAVALAAYAAHGVDGPAQSALQTAALFAFGHGVAILALVRQAHRIRGVMALCVVLAGALLFCGSLVATHLLGVPVGLAPLGGMVMIVGWLLVAFAEIGS